MEGQYRVIVKFANVEIPKSPFSVNVEGKVGDASKCTASGPGLEKSGNMVGKTTYFEVFTKGKLTLPQLKQQLKLWCPNQLLAVFFVVVRMWCN